MFTTGVTVSLLKRNAITEIIMNPPIIFFSAILCSLASPLIAAGVGCGRQAAQFQPSLPSKTRIIGGEIAKSHSWPWQVSIRRFNGTEHFCGGTVLRVSDDKDESDLVLTAAHCVPTRPNGSVGGFSFMTVVAGTNTHPAKVTAGEEYRRVVDVQYHQNYTKATKINDLAILKLDKPLVFSDTIRPICVVSDGEAIPLGRVCVATGWGRNESDSGKTPEDLKQALSPVHAIETCTKTWAWQKEAWSYAFLCAGPLDASSSACHGDSGGPLVCKSDDGTWIQHGVASYVANKGCAEVGKPPVFVRLATYAGWIRQKIESMTALKG